ncbi:NAD-dependent dehydratase [Bradyrhizobium sp. WBOS7]|uniref:NAD-dependent dehydratase n=1 Tax=Bradyrhizobium betae TaxID=244734 RepID=A0AAE9NFD2_9BRAD|nr:MULTISPECIES: NAD-dependent epimerase/dehydratase family protein [Bradyrhizobium]MDD1569358.1 NAD-dependent dehydratase [Bradyrhizobium sp. WBOS1]UUO38150.1 NAD-dependent dehydratase [Bradyrhizobium sp. WBOS01]MDD1529831.1 NAD-dependent dehydratase [Bradyrhizobium sp. WBOS2]MDD1576477.1 NAD-dependent dehydratase [Bradyrhizobium sp. WBOS7]MDD1602318.1 NAD-dependent dehydratase [Bradyrhizobium sp. WBOS16]
MKILVVGASGFVGGHLVRRLAADGIPLRVGVHRNRGNLPAGIDVVENVDLEGSFDWRSAVAGCDVVAHLGARVHVMRENNANALDAYRCVNVDGTLRLARQAAAAGVRRFVFLSSVKVCGESTAPDTPFDETATPHPQDPYGLSKLEAECGLLELSRASGMQVVVLRPPLIYGPGVRANFLSMMRWLRRGVPLPLGSIENRRSLIGVGNMVDLICACLRHPAAAGEVFMASDGEDLSTPELLRRLAMALDTKARLLPIPVSLLEGAAALVGQRALAQRLCFSLCVDSQKARKILGWRPPFSVDDELRRTARAFLGSR